MTDLPQEPAAPSALDIAQSFIHAVESKDLDTVAQLLKPEARQLFMQTNRTKTADGVIDIITGNARGLCVADVKGRDEILAYTTALFDKFTPLIWRDHRWTASESSNKVFFYGKGNMIVARTGRPYRNTYVTRFDIEDGKVIRIAEYGDALTYAGLRIRPNGAEFRALLRALGRLVLPQYGRPALAGRRGNPYT